MSQSVFNNIDPDETGGAELAALLNNFKTALLTAHSGETAPEYAEQGTEWLDVSATPYVFKRFDGSAWAPVYDINPSTHVLRLYHAGVVLGALATKDSLSASDIPNNAINTARLQDDAVTQDKIANAAVGAAQIKSAEAQDILTALLTDVTQNYVLKGTGTGYEFGSPAVAASSTDAAPGYLDQKLAAGSLLAIETFDAGSGNRKVRVKLANGTPGKVIGFNGSGNPAEIDGPIQKTLEVHEIVVTGGNTFNWVVPAGIVGALVQMKAGGGAGGTEDGYGGSGNSSSFGSLVTVTGGIGGFHSAVSPRTGGAGGAASGGTINIPGEKGRNGVTNTITHAALVYHSGEGGNNCPLLPYGKGGDGWQSNSSGVPAGPSGGGGGEGGYAEKWIPGSSLSGTIVLTAGAGGATTGSNTSGYRAAENGYPGIVKVLAFVEV